MTGGGYKALLIQFLVEKGADTNADLRREICSLLELTAVVNADPDDLMSLLLEHSAAPRRRELLLAARAGRVDMLEQARR
jgi:hypothetical protein